MMSLENHGEYGQRLVMDDRPADCWVSLLPSWLTAVQVSYDDDGKGEWSEHPERKKFRDLIAKEPTLFRVWCDPEGPKNPVIFESDLGFGTKEAVVRFRQKNLLQRIIVTNSGLTFPTTLPGSFGRGFSVNALDGKAAKGEHFRFVAMSVKKNVRDANDKSQNFRFSYVYEDYRNRSNEEFDELQCKYWPVETAAIDRFKPSEDIEDDIDSETHFRGYSLDWFKFLFPLGISEWDLCSLTSAYFESVSGEASDLKYLFEFCGEGMNNIEASDRSVLLVQDLPLAATKPDKYLMEYDPDDTYVSAEVLFISRLEQYLSQAQQIKTSLCYGPFALMTNDLLWLLFNKSRKANRKCRLCGAHLTSQHASQQVCSKTANPGCYRQYERERKRENRNRSKVGGRPHPVDS